MSASNGDALSISNLQPNAGILTANAGSQVSISGNYTQTSAGAINLQIGGAATGQEGTVSISGNANLAGTLNVSLVNGFTPANGDKYQVMTYSAVSGTFTTFNGPDLSGAGLVMTPTYNSGNLSLNVGQAQRADTRSALPAGSSPVLTLAELQPIEQAAIARWSAVVPAADLSALRQTTFQIADMQSPYLGLTSGSTIWISANAAGYGWFIDTTPMNDSDFAATTVPNELIAAANSPAAGHMDLLTVVMHELGHVLGLGDVPNGNGPDTLMTEDLPTGERGCRAPW